MSARFYAAWGIVVLLAFVLPVAIPYAIWSPPADYTCEKGVRNAVVSETPYAVGPVAVEVRDARCSASDWIEPYWGRVTIRGPYGIPIAEGHVEARSISHPDERGVLIAGLALLCGAGLVSIPFAVTLLHRSLKMRASVAA